MLDSIDCCGDEDFFFASFARAIAAALVSAHNKCLSEYVSHHRHTQSFYGTGVRHCCICTHNTGSLVRWIGSLVVRALESQFDGREFDSQLPRLILGWVTISGRTNHLSVSSSHPGQLSLLPSVGREMSTSQSVVMLCGWRVKTGVVHFTCG